MIGSPPGKDIEVGILGWEGHLYIALNLSFSDELLISYVHTLSMGGSCQSHSIEVSPVQAWFCSHMQGELNFYADQSYHTSAMVTLSAEDASLVYSTFTHHSILLNEHPFQTRTKKR